MSLSIKSNLKDSGDIWIVKLSGELDVSCAMDVKSELEKTLEDKFLDIKLDMSSLEYIDSTGIGVIVGVMKKLKAGGKDIYILNARDNVKKIFKITGLDQIMHMEG